MLIPYLLKAITWKKKGFSPIASSRSTLLGLSVTLINVQLDDPFCWYPTKNFVTSPPSYPGIQETSTVLLEVWLTLTSLGCWGLPARATATHVIIQHHNQYNNTCESRSLILSKAVRYHTANTPMMSHGRKCVWFYFLLPPFAFKLLNKTNQWRPLFSERVSIWRELAKWL